MHACNGRRYVPTGRGEESKQSAEHSHTVVDSLRTRLKDTTAEFKQVRRASCNS